MSYRAGPQAVLVVAFNSQVFGLDAATGKRLWSSRGTADNVPPRVLVHGDRVLVAGLEEDSVLLCLDLASGAVLWRRRTQTYGGGLLVDDGRVFLTGNGEVECLGLDGEPLWFDGFKGLGRGAVAMALPGQAVHSDT
ncbi:MAG: PQQ-binding-like beta-propeller repeat protein [Polyangiaceae bacterium]